MTAPLNELKPAESAPERDNDYLDAKVAIRRQRERHALRIEKLLADAGYPAKVLNAWNGGISQMTVEVKV
jgi:hypothetical protein